jgi:hypothetical protein
MKNRWSQVALLLTGCVGPCVEATPSADRCLGLVGPAAEVEQLEMSARWDRPCGDGLTVIRSAEELEHLWTEDTGPLGLEIDFTTQQLVCTSYWSGCGGGTEIMDISWAARHPGSLLVQIRDRCRCPEDCPGNRETQAWLTPIAPILRCVRQQDDPDGWCD